ncbi:uncharacterized protein LOC127285953 [Leptopilina boulardi]|uniref:uncharacterized protein LOC127285953 n=1 Tax=Leptopilina boulardi TaxID=63433 RepID=UPI0021F549D5|nr:uncharacterized protein LOC127285953 [Leptopilina boulardi]
MLAALKDVENGMTLSAASKLYNVPRTTLWDKYHGRSPVERKMGPECVLSKEEETLLVQWMFDVGKCGFPVTKEQLLDSVQLLVKELKKSTCFTNGRPGRAWYDAFRKRHPEISQRVSQNLTKNRASLTENKIRGWFKEITEYFEENLLSSLLADGSRIFNCDETAFFLCPKGNHVLVKKGDKAVYNFVNSDEKECITTLINGNASGQLVPPMVIFSYKRVPADIAASIPKTWALGTSSNGWMTGETFFEYIANIFHPWILKEKIPLPVILYLMDTLLT